MTVKEIKDLIKTVDQSDLAEFKFKNSEFEIQMRNQKFFKGDKQHIITTAPNMMQMPAQVQAVAPVATPDLPATAAAPTADTEATGNYIEVKSPIVGTFYRSSSPDKPAFASVGDKIEKGTVVCIIEAMKLFNEIESEVSGTIVKVLVEDASPVEYDQPLFLVEP